MKRFRTSLDSYYAICLQQSRMAKLELARRRQAVDDAQRQYAAAVDAERRSLDEAARQRRGPVAVAALLCVEHQVACSGQQVLACRERVVQFEQDLQVARREFEQKKTREEQVSRFIERKRQEHRVQTLKEQQIQTDEVASRRWQPGEEETAHG